MPRRALALKVFVLVLVATAAYTALMYQQLPDPMAAHFDGSGEADGYQSKKSFFVLYGLLVTAMAASFAGIAWLLPRVPISMINLPHRDVYLAPDRREDTLDEIAGFLVWMGTATVVFMAWVMHLTFRANLSPGAPRLGGEFLVSLIVYLLLTLGASVRFFLRYRAPR